MAATNNDSSAQPDPENETKKKRGRPSSGVSRAEQFRRANAARRATSTQVNLIMPNALHEAVTAAAKDHPHGNNGFIVDLLTENLQALGFYTPLNK